MNEFREEQKMDKQKFFDAADEVCMECAFKEEACNTCPVRQTVHKLKAANEANQKDREIKRAIFLEMFK